VEQDDVATAYWFQRGASAGKTDAMIALGRLYAAGRGVPQDWTAAVEWWTKAGAWQFVGDAYACGVGVEQDYDRAVRAYTTGSNTHDPGSAIHLGHVHAAGCATAPDVTLAFTSYQIAAERGYPEAQAALSGLAVEGRGPDAHPWSAYYWARLAELRLPAGELQRLAQRYAATAPRHMPTAMVRDAETMVQNMIQSGREPMNR
jgi:uncharacterized protein